MEKFAFSNRLSRQYGLVHQGAVENLNILIAGDNEILPYLLLNLAFCGVGSLQGGCYLEDIAPVVTRRHIYNQFLLKSEDFGLPLIDALAARLKNIAPHFDLKLWPGGGEKRIVPDLFIVLPAPEDSRQFQEYSHCCRLYGQLGPSSLYVGHGPLNVKNFEANIFTPSLASLAGAILAQDVLRLTNSLRAIEVLDQKVLVSLRLKSEKIQKYLSLPPHERNDVWHGVSTRLRLGSEELPIISVEASEDKQEGIFHVLLPTETILSRLILDSIEIIEEPLEKDAGILPPLFISILGDDIIHGADLQSNTAEYPAVLDEMNAVIVGVGGLGTWVCGILATTRAKKSRLTLVDSDAEIEEHNLNRQILFTSKDIGQPKVYAAAASIKKINPDVKIHIYHLELADDIIRLLNDGLFERYSAPTPPRPKGKLKSGQEPELDIQTIIARNEESELRKKMLAGDMAQTQVYLSCIDNMRSRWILNCAAWVAGKTFVNGGAKGLGGQVDYYEKSEGDASLITRFGLGIKTDTNTVRCGGAIPILAIVTTNAIIASLQSLLAVIRLSGRRPKEANYFLFDGNGRVYWENLFKELPGSEDPLGVAEILGA
jgi:molybdopterin/thiamine biosynthesis adenylyltransferase